jgi:hypothetical protein
MLFKHREICVVDYSAGVFARCDIEIASREVIIGTHTRGRGPSGGRPKKKGTPYRTPLIIIKSKICIQFNL